MAEVTSHPPGSFSWPELATTDQKAAVSFYRALFGWDLNEQPLGPGAPLLESLELGGELSAGRLRGSEHSEAPDGDEHRGAEHERQPGEEGREHHACRRSYQRPAGSMRGEFRIQDAG